MKKQLGRYDFICELSRSFIGPLWAAKAGSGAGEGLPATIRRVGTRIVDTDVVDLVSECAWWGMEVDHAQISPIVDVVVGDGELGIVTDYVDGEPLKSLLRQAGLKRNPFPIEVALRVIVDTLEGLAAVHEAASDDEMMKTQAMGGLTPDSVFVGSDGSARLLDVGLAGVVSKIPAYARHPDRACYAAPEVVDEGAIDARTDIFAIGIALWEMLSNRRLFVGVNYEGIVKKVLSAPIARLDSIPSPGDPIPPGLIDIVAKCLERDPEKRYASCEELIAAINDSDASVGSWNDTKELVRKLAGYSLAPRRKAIERATGEDTTPLSSRYRSTAPPRKLSSQTMPAVHANTMKVVAPAPPAAPKAPSKPILGAPTIPDAPKPVLPPTASPAPEAQTTPAPAPSPAAPEAATAPAPAPSPPSPEAATSPAPAPSPPVPEAATSPAPAPAAPAPARPAPQAAPPPAATGAPKAPAPPRAEPSPHRPRSGTLLGIPPPATSPGFAPDEASTLPSVASPPTAEDAEPISIEPASLPPESIEPESIEPVSIEPITGPAGGPPPAGEAGAGFATPGAKPPWAVPEPAPLPAPNRPAPPAQPPPKPTAPAADAPKPTAPAAEVPAPTPPPQPPAVADDVPAPPGFLPSEAGTLPSADDENAPQTSREVSEWVDKMRTRGSVPDEEEAPLQPVASSAMPPVPSASTAGGAIAPTPAADASDEDVAVLEGREERRKKARLVVIGVVATFGLLLVVALIVGALQGDSDEASPEAAQGEAPPATAAPTASATAAPPVAAPSADEKVADAATESEDAGAERDAAPDAPPEAEAPKEVERPAEPAPPRRRPPRRKRPVRRYTPDDI